MQVGQYDQFFELQTSTDTTDDWGQPIKSWSVTASFYGKLITERGREFVSRGEMDTSQKPISIVTHHRDDITPDLRIVWQGEVYEIVGVVPNYRINETQINAVWTEGRQ